MDKRYWEHEPIKGMKEYYNSDDWWDVQVVWFLAKALVIGGAIGVIWLLSLFA
jgi:hypothetical protein